MKHITAYIILNIFIFNQAGMLYPDRLTKDALRPVSAANAEMADLRGILGTAEVTENSLSVDLAGIIKSSSLTELEAYLERCSVYDRKEAVWAFISQSTGIRSVKLLLASNIFGPEEYMEWSVMQDRCRFFTELDYYERLEFISECISLALRRQDSKHICAFLKELAESKRRTFFIRGELILPNVLMPEARKLISSYVTVYELDKPTNISTVFAVYKEQDKVRPGSKDNPNGQDFLRRKIRQLANLYSVNPKLAHRLVIVQDGDDGPYRYDLKKSIDIIKQIIKEEFSGLLDSGQIVLLELSQLKRELIKSAKGGALLYGMRWAYDHGADYIISTDADLSTPLDQEGLLLDKAVNGKKDVVIGSIYRQDSIVPPRTWFRRLKSRVFLRLENAILPELKAISDTQRSFKCYSREAFEVLTPINENGAFDRYFIYNPSFEVNMLALAMKAGLSIGEKGIIWKDYPEGSAVTSRYIPRMVKGLSDIRRFLDYHSADYLARAKAYRVQDSGRNILLIDQAA